MAKSTFDLFTSIPSYANNSMVCDCNFPSSLFDISFPEASVYFDAEELTQSRHKYSHLIPDDDKMVSKAVAGDDLYDLTQKCIVLLTCCILDNIGLTTDEINICFKDSAIQQIVRDLPPTFD